MTVAEIAYEVGFSSPSYFTKCYKEQFGESPTEFLKEGDSCCLSPLFLIHVCLLL